MFLLRSLRGQLEKPVLALSTVLPVLLPVFLGEVYSSLTDVSPYVGAFLWAAGFWSDYRKLRI